MTGTQLQLATDCCGATGQAKLPARFQTHEGRSANISLLQMGLLRLGGLHGAARSKDQNKLQIQYRPMHYLQRLEA